MNRKKIKDARIRLVDGDRSEKYPKRTEFVSEGVVFLNAESIKDGCINLETANYISESKYLTVSKGRIQFNDIVMTTRGNGTGDVAFVGKKIERGLINAQMLILRADETELDAQFLYYLLRSPSFSSSMRSFRSGSAQPQLPMFALKEMEIEYPDVPIQQRMGSILSAYDHLIEHNTRRIKVLEDMAQMLFQEWFVNFRFPGHEKVRMVESELGPIPQGWQVPAFAEILDSSGGGDWGSDAATVEEPCRVHVVRGTDFTDLERGNAIRVPQRFITSRSLSKRRLVSGDILVENSVNAKTRCSGSSLLITPGVLRRLGGDSIGASFCKVFRLKRPQIAPVVLLHLKRLHENGGMAYYQNVAANGIANFQATRFVSTERMALPTDNSLLAQMVDSLSCLTSSNPADIIHNLRTTRDFLLPKLISGEVSVEAAAELMEQTA
jgi:type I restriction enzyme, S subunit